VSSGERPDRQDRQDRQDRLARRYDEDIHSPWAARFARLMFRGLAIPPRALVLDVACRTGASALEMLSRMDEAGRVIAIDPSEAMLDVARRKARDLSGKRVIFRTENLWPRLPFTADVYDVTLCNLGVHELPSPRAALRELVRVTKPGGGVRVTLPLSGTWKELHQIYREVLVRLGHAELRERLEAMLAAAPDAARAEGWLAAAGLTETRVEVEEFALSFESARGFFFAPVIEHGPLPRWKEIAGRGPELQDAFREMKRAIDAVCARGRFQVTVVAACLSGTKRAGDEAETGKVDLVEPHELVGPREQVEEEEGVLPVNTGEIELLEADDIELDAFPRDPPSTK
jgi:ubiquinone/menaquinone biosynthesis C-methylase UbiE